MTVGMVVRDFNGFWWPTLGQPCKKFTLNSEDNSTKKIEFGIIIKMYIYLMKYDLKEDN